MGLCERHCDTYTTSPVDHRPLLAQFSFRGVSAAQLSQSTGEWRRRRRSETASITVCIAKTKKNESVRWSVVVFIGPVLNSRCYPSCIWLPSCVVLLSPISFHPGDACVPLSLFPRRLASQVPANKTRGVRLPELSQMRMTWPAALVVPRFPSVLCLSLMQDTSWRQKRGRF